MFGVRETPLERQGSGVRRRTNNCECNDVLAVNLTYSMLLSDPPPRAVQTHGKDWVAVADLVQRSAADCSDQFRQHIQYNEIKRKGMYPGQHRSLFSLCIAQPCACSKGTWSSEEEGQLLHAIKGLARDGKSDIAARG